MKFGLGSLMMVVALSAVFLAGCGDKGPGEPETYFVDNYYCPVMGKQIDPDGVPADYTVEFEGKRIGFCCKECISKWKDMSDDEKAAKVAEVMARKAPPIQPH